MFTQFLPSLDLCFMALLPKQIYNSKLVRMGSSDYEVQFEFCSIIILFRAFFCVLSSLWSKDCSWKERAGMVSTSVKGVKSFRWPLEYFALL